MSYQTILLIPIDFLSYHTTVPVSELLQRQKIPYRVISALSIVSSDYEFLQNSNSNNDRVIIVTSLTDDQRKYKRNEKLERELQIQKIPHKYAIVRNNERLNPSVSFLNDQFVALDLSVLSNGHLGYVLKPSSDSEWLGISNVKANNTDNLLFQESECAFFQTAGVGCPNIVFLAKWVAYKALESKFIQSSTTTVSAFVAFVLKCMKDIRQEHNKEGLKLTFRIPKAFASWNNKSSSDDSWTFADIDLFNDKVSAVEKRMKTTPLDQDGKWFIEQATNYTTKFVSLSSDHLNTNIETSQIVPDPQLVPSTTVDYAGRKLILKQIEAQWRYLLKDYVTLVFPKLAAIGIDSMYQWIRVQSLAPSTNQLFSEIEKVLALFQVLDRQIRSLKKPKDLETFQQFLSGEYPSSDQKEWDRKIPKKLHHLLKPNKVIVESIVDLYEKESDRNWYLFLLLFIPRLILLLHQFAIVKKLLKLSTVETGKDALDLYRKISSIYANQCTDSSATCSAISRLLTENESILQQYSGAPNVYKDTLSHETIRSDKRRYLADMVRSEEESKRIFDSLKLEIDNIMTNLRAEVTKSISDNAEMFLLQKLYEFSKIMFKIQSDFKQLSNFSTFFLPKEPTDPVDLSTLKKALEGVAYSDYLKDFSNIVSQAKCIFEKYTKETQGKNIGKTERIDVPLLLSQILADFQSILRFWIEENLYKTETVRRGFLNILLGRKEFDNVEYTLKSLARRIDAKSITDLKSTEKKKALSFIIELQSLWTYLNQKVNTKVTFENLEITSDFDCAKDESTKSISFSASSHLPLDKFTHTNTTRAGNRSSSWINF